ncbi:MAG TPA: diguanylate cyclase [Capillimicrobium sp.]|nr:diguanylate cyclase [Capillimicrobium sp.]
MRIVRPGAPVPEDPVLVRRRRLGRAVCAAIVAGWAVAALSAELQGTAADHNAWLLAAIGVVTGITWATKRFDEQPPGSLQVLLLAASLQATAASLAFDRGVVAAWPFALMLAVVAGQVGRNRAEIAGQAGVLAAGQLLAAAFGPDRAATAMDAAIVLAPSIMLLASASAAWHELRAGRPEEAGDAMRLHERLAEAVAGDPERFAVLTMDVHGLGADRIAAVRDALAAEVRDADVVARSGKDGLSILASDTDGDGAAALARRIEQAMREYRHAETGALQAAIGIAVYPEDGRTADELLARADAALAERRAAEPRLRVVAR